MDLNFIAPATATGSVRTVVVLSPSWPPRLSPQQYALPSAVRAHAWPPPTVSWVKVRAVVTAFGVSCFGVAEERAPQQYALPSVVRAQVSASPAPMPWKASPPLTTVGERLFVVVPLPSW